MLSSRIVSSAKISSGLISLTGFGVSVISTDVSVCSDEITAGCVICEAVLVVVVAGGIVLGVVAAVVFVAMLGCQADFACFGGGCG